MTTKPAKNASVEPEAVAIADIVPGGATGALAPNEDVAAVYADIDTLVEWAKNPRNNQKAILKVAKSIRRFGFGEPILAREENREIIAGHTRYRAAKALGLKRVPVRFMPLDEDEAHKLAIADNKLGEIAEWDDEKLEDMVLEMSIQEAQLLGFEMKELAAFGDEDEQKDTQSKLTGLVYKLVVTCADEGAQADLMNRLELEGFEVSPLIS